MSFFPHAFSGPVEFHNLGRYSYTVLWLPEGVAAELPLAEQPRLRISGELNEEPCHGAWQPSRGRWYLMLGKPLLRVTGLSVGCLAELRFRIEPQDEVDTPALLTRALASSEPAALRWTELTPGKRRAVGHYIGSAKTGPTMSKRIAQAMLWLEQEEADLRQLPKMQP